MRTRALRRHFRKKTIERKKKLIKLKATYWYYKYEGSLHKSKIHCSCPRCSYYRKHRKDFYYNEQEKLAFREANYETASYDSVDCFEPWNDWVPSASS